MNTYVAAILGEEEQRASWRESLRGRLREWGIELEPLGDERWMISNRICGDIGAAELIDAEEGRERYAEEAWASQRSPCPFLDDLSVVGFVEWEEWDADARKDWLIALVKEGKGFIAKPGASDCRSAVIEIKACALGLLSKWGFEDGDTALTRDEGRKNYRGAVCRQMEQTLAAHGLYTYVGGPEVTCHNLFRSYGGFYLDADYKVPLEDEDEIRDRLLDITLQFWGYDFTIAEDPMFDSPLE